MPRFGVARPGFSIARLMLKTSSMTHLKNTLPFVRERKAKILKQRCKRCTDRHENETERDLFSSLFHAVSAVPVTSDGFSLLTRTFKSL